MVSFIGVKIALIVKNSIVVIKRDDKPGLRFAGMWDLPGGGRDGNESPIQCVTREVEEELGMHLNPASIIWQKEFPAMQDPTLTAWFMVAEISRKDIASIEFGHEGQAWQLMAISDFLEREDVIGPLQERLRSFLTADS